MFMGEYKHTIDSKNRLFMPVRFRMRTKNKKVMKYVVTRGLDGCLYVYMPEEWRQLSEKFKSLPIKNKIAERAFKRALLSGASEVQLDAQGRILIPTHLTQFAGITGDVIIIGVMDHAEIWSKKRWIEYKKYADKSFKQLAPQLEI
ncbi:MAG: division/cell wall cluster transcriptional repressor MraZ [Elusimicrobia bacterium]|nr:division/cell wall cluster transcriptional repressor MraZ [Elusimicrobiota bacterium]MBD3411597.1 division/cell wall cluster transcriptional repressor MraZ [Elusimicrobiota bacterium]